MKVNELMIGDWVYRTDFNTPVPSKIIGMEVVNYDKMEYVVDVFNKNGYNVLLYLNEIEPIPLTPEILEKNGWVKNIYSAESYDNEELERLSLWVGEDGKNKRWWLVGLELVTPINYVHELQHALRLCGIEKTITL